MKFAITASNADNYFAIKEFQTVDDLIRFMKENENDIIITHNFSYKQDLQFVRLYNPEVDAEELAKIPYAIEIYDGYRE